MFVWVFHKVLGERWKKGDWIELGWCFRVYIPDTCHYFICTKLN